MPPVEWALSSIGGLLVITKLCLPLRNPQVPCAIMTAVVGHRCHNQKGLLFGFLLASFQYTKGSFQGRGIQVGSSSGFSGSVSEVLAVFINRDRSSTSGAL